MKKAHRKFIRDYNTHIHFTHRERRDDRHSPQDVLRGVLARTVEASTLARIFFATHFTRHLDRSGYIRFRRWRFYAEAGLARQSVTVYIYTSTLKTQYQDTELAFSTMEWAEGSKHIKEVKHPRVIETGYRSPQLTLWTLGPDRVVTRAFSCLTTQRAKSRRGSRMSSNSLFSDLMETTRMQTKLSVDRQMDGYPAVAEANAGLPTVPAPRIEDRLRPLTLCRSAWLPCASDRTSANRGLHW